MGEILVAVNPFERFPIYGPDVQKKYLQAHKDEVPPHVYYIAVNAYEQMLRRKDSQCFVISGESGAGKSETTKFLVAHLIEVGVILFAG